MITKFALPLHLFAITISAFTRQVSENDILALNTDDACQKYALYCSSKNKSTPPSSSESTTYNWKHNFNESMISELNKPIQFCGSSSSKHR